MEMKVMHKNSGFTLMELMTTIAVIAVLAAIAVPNMISWRSGTKLQGAVENLRGDLQLAKLKAVQEGDVVTVTFFKDVDDVYGYNVVTSGGTTLRDRRLPAGISIDFGVGATGFAGDDFARFNNRGLPVETGKVVIVSSGGEVRNIELNRLGRIDIY
jgi:type IV fimbrial biogenesis protein FimT